MAKKPVNDDIFEGLKEWLEDQRRGRDETLDSVRQFMQDALETRGGERFLQGGRNVASGATALNLFGRDMGREAGRRISEFDPEMALRDLQDPLSLFGFGRGRGQYDELNDAWKNRIMNQFEDQPTFQVGPGQPHQEGRIPDGSHLLFSGGVLNEKRFGGKRHSGRGGREELIRQYGLGEMLNDLQSRGFRTSDRGGGGGAGPEGRNQREGRIKDMERDLNIKEKLEKLEDRVRNRNTTPPKGAEFTNRR